jgi:hypothetical protein
MGFLDGAKAGADAFLNPSMSAAPETADPCEPLKEESERIFKMKDSPEKSAAISAGLQMIAAQDCEEQLGYYDLVDEFCSRDSHFVGMQIGHGETCMDKDIHGDQAAIWCMRKDIDEDTGIENDYPRMKTRTDVCNERGLKSRWHSTNAKYCELYPEDDWCRCYNVKENKKICYAVDEEGNPKKYGPKSKPAAGCNLFDSLEQNKVFYKDGYQIYKDNMHCTRNTCTRPTFQYIPEGAMSSCKPTYRMCDKDIDIINSSLGTIVLACNADMPESEKPDWWDEEGDGDDGWLSGYRSPPFDSFPLNKTPITEWPEEFDWEDDNVRYLTFYSIGSSVLCIIILIIIMKSLKKK